MMGPAMGPQIDTNEWVRAQFVVTIQSVIIGLLITAPLNIVVSFVTNLLKALANYAGLKSIEISGPIGPGKDTFESRAIKYLLEDALCTSSAMVHNKFVPDGWMISRKCYGTSYVSVEDVKFTGLLFPWAAAAIDAIQREVINVGCGPTHTTVRSIRTVEVPAGYFSTAAVLTFPVPNHVLRSQQTPLDKLISDFKMLTSKTSLRGARYINVLLTGQPGCGKTVMVHHLTDQLKGILVTCKSMNVEALENLKKTLALVRTMHRDTQSTILNPYSTPDPKDKNRESSPIVILIDEWDSVMSENTPSISDRCIERMRKDGLSGDKLVEAIEDLQSELANTTHNTKNKRPTNDFMDFLTTQDNTVTVFVTNTTMRHVNRSFVRDGRITHRVQMPTLTRSDVMEFIQTASAQWGWVDASRIIGKALPDDSTLPPIATVVQTLDLSETPHDAARLFTQLANVANIAASKEPSTHYITTEEDDKKSNNVATMFAASIALFDKYRDMISPAVVDITHVVPVAAPAPVAATVIANVPVPKPQSETQSETQSLSNSVVKTRMKRAIAKIIENDVCDGKSAKDKPKRKSRTTKS